MNKTDLLKQIARAIATAARGIDPKVKVTSGKVVAGLGAANLADDLILDKVPGLKKAMIWTDEKITQGQQWLVDNTLGKIPGVGPIISKLHKRGTDARHKIRDALFGSNNPAWYEHLPQHVPFTIPGSYNNKNVKFITSNGSTTAIPSVATVNLVRNVVTTPYATNSRYSEIYTAVKYARGLSYLSYDVNQLALMFEIGNELTVMYYKLSKAVAAAFHYSLTKANLPNQIIKGLGITDIIEHYAEYLTLLDQMYNYMSVNSPLLPIMHSKLRQMCLFTALDSKHPAMSTYIQAQVRNNNLRLPVEGTGFYSSSVLNMSTIEDYRREFKGYMDLISGSSTTSELLNVIADVKGAIQSVVYVDNWRNIKFQDTFTEDALFLNSIKNMDLIPMFGIVGTESGSTMAAVCDLFVDAWQGTSSNPIDIAKGIPQSVTVRMKSVSSVGLGNFAPQYVCCSGSKEIKPFAESISGQSTPYHFDLTNDKYRFTNRLVSLDGTEASEGMVLETVSLSHITRECSIEAPNDKTQCFVNITVDPSLFVGLYIEVANGYGDGEVTVLQHKLNVPGWNLADAVYGTATAWSLVDWMPALRLTSFVSAATYYTAQLWDINGIGSLSYTAIGTAIDYITYSLLYPGDVEALNKVELANKLISSLRTK